MIASTCGQGWAGLRASGSVMKVVEIYSSETCIYQVRDVIKNVSLFP